MAIPFWPAGYYSEPNPEMEDIILSSLINFLQQYPMTEADASRRAQEALTDAHRWAATQLTVAEYLQNRGQFQVYLRLVAIHIARQQLPPSWSWLRQLLEKMSASDRRLLLWFYEEKFSAHEIALLLEVGIPTVQVALTHANARLRQLMDRETIRVANGWRPDTSV